MTSGFSQKERPGPEPPQTGGQPDDRTGGPAGACRRATASGQPAIAAGLLASRGAAGIPHPGGTLLAHLERVSALLGQWGARPAVRLAGLCHAYYGTDGFPVMLGEPASRGELAAVMGEEAERLVYFYASCDRHFSYPRLAEPAGTFRDRFTGTVLSPPEAMRRDFAELTAANELDIAAVNPELRAQYRPVLLRLFTSWKNLLSDPAWHAVQATIACTPPGTPVIRVPPAAPRVRGNDQYRSAATRAGARVSSDHRS